MLVGAMATGAFALRLPGLFTDFWLDEIWTLEIARRLRSPLDLFTEVRDSNNHHLNTFLYYLLDPLVGESGHWSLYRLHSFLAGVGCVILVWLIAARIGRREGLFACLLAATSYPLIHFSSEGRGYALVIFFALASYLVLSSFAETRRWRSAAAFWLLACR